MIKINNLSIMTLEKMKKAFSSSLSPIKKVANQDYYVETCDVFIDDKALIIYARNELSIYYYGKIFRMSLFDFLRVEIE